jgi:hypothetical protein
VCYITEESCFGSRQGQERFLLFKASSSAPGSTQLPVQCVPAIFARGKAARAWSWPLQSSSEVKNERSHTLFSRVRSWHAQGNLLYFYYCYCYYCYYYSTLFQVLFVIFIWYLIVADTHETFVCYLGRSGLLWSAPDSGSKFIPQRIHFTQKIQVWKRTLRVLLTTSFFGMCTYSEWLIMRFAAGPEISFFHRHAVPVLAHTQFSLHLGAHPGL